MNDTVLLIYANHVGFCFCLKSINVSEANSTLTNSLSFYHFLRATSVFCCPKIEIQTKLTYHYISVFFLRLSHLETMELDEMQPWIIGNYMNKQS